LQIDGDDFASWAHALGCVERPRARGCAQIEHALAWFQELQASIDFFELEDAARRVASLAGGARVTIRTAGRVALCFPRFLAGHGAAPSLRG
jgi:hypothetical protein